MARAYNKVDYTTIDLTKLTVDELKSFIYNAAATANARIKAANAESLGKYTEGIRFIEHIKKTKYGGKFFTKNGTFRKSVEKFSVKELKEYGEALADVLSYDTAKQELNKISQSKSGKKLLTGIRLSDPKLFEAVVRKLSDKEFEPDIDGSPKPDEVEAIKEVYHMDITSEDIADAINEIGTEQLEEEIEEGLAKPSELYEMKFDITTGKMYYIDKNGNKKYI